MFEKLIEKFWDSTPARIAGFEAKLEAAQSPGAPEREELVGLLHMLKGEAQMLRIELAAPLLTATHQLMKYLTVHQAVTDETKNLLLDAFRTLDQLCAGRGEASGAEESVRRVEDAAERVLITSDRPPEMS